jgi:class 3 adenylate cyclase
VLTWLVAALAVAMAAIAAGAVHRVVATQRRLEVAARELETLQRAFARFAPAEVVEDVIAQGVSPRSESKEVTVLFADLQGFTALAERLEPARLVAVLNGFFEAMSRALAANRGHLAKFLGDGFLALFGALEHNPWQAQDAVRAALAMRQALADYNARIARDGVPPLAVGIGIHRGAVVTGVIGTAGLLEYGVVGRAVNLASRVEKLTRIHGTDILVTEEVRRALGPQVVLRIMPAVEAKGIPGPLVTYAVDRWDDA